MNKTYYQILDLLIKYSTVSLAIFTIFVNIAKLIHLPFATIAYAVFIMWICKLSGFAKAVHNKLSGKSIERCLPVVLLICFAISTGILTGSISPPEEDDVAYVAPVIKSINNPEMPISPYIEWVAPWSSGDKLKNDFNLLSPVYEYSWGIVSYLTGIDYLILYQLIGSIIWGAAFFSIYFYLFSKFIDEKASLFASFCLVALCLTIFREGGIGIGVCLNKIWIGKTILIMIMVPLIAAFAYDFIYKPSKSSWLYVCLACIAASGFSSSSFFMVPSLILVLTLGRIFTPALYSGKQEIFNSLALLVTPIYCLGIGAVNYFMLRDKLGLSMNAKLGYSGELIFYSTYKVLFGSFLSVSSFIIFFSIIYLIFIHQKEYLLVLGWFSFSIMLFVNPFVADFVSLNLTTYLAYARLFFIVPWFLLIGLTLGSIYQIISVRIHYSIIYLCISTVFILFTIAVIYTFGWDRVQTALDVSKTYYLGKPFFSFPSRKINVELLKDAYSISKVLPPGNTLSTIEYNLTMPMITDKYPQYYAWPPKVMHFLAESSGNQAEGEIRSGAGQFLMGDITHRDEFEKLISYPVKNIIIGRKWVRNISYFEKTALLNGFVLLESNPRYLLFSRPR